MTFFFKFRDYDLVGVWLGLGNRNLLLTIVTYVTCNWICNWRFSCWCKLQHFSLWCFELLAWARVLIRLTLIWVAALLAAPPVWFIIRRSGGCLQDEEEADNTEHHKCLHLCLYAETVDVIPQVCTIYKTLQLTWFYYPKPGLCDYPLD